MPHSIEVFHDAWWFLEGHPAFKKQVGKDDLIEGFQEALDIYVTKVNPETKSIDDDPSKNTKVQVWLECGKWLNAKEFSPDFMRYQLPQGYFGAFMHDVELDCGSDTFEDAIIRLAYLVLQKYGDYERET